MRDFTVDPIDEARVQELKESIKEDGFWGGIVCRQVDHGDIEIGAGHHRVRAAIAAGIRTADIFVGNGQMDDAAMVRVYARENATQRGNTGTAQAGSVASAVRFIAKGLLTGNVVGIPTTSEKAIEILTGQIASDKGIGWSIVVSFLDGIPGINKSTADQALANLKASGDYARIIKEVQEQIERENREAIKALEQAEREQKRLQKEREAAEERQRQAEAARKEAAAQAKAAREEADKKRTQEALQRAELEQKRAEEQAKLAAKRRKEADEEMKKFDAMRKTRDTAAKAVKASESKPKTFDFEGVAKHLKNAHQIDVFRECVTGPGITPYLPVDRQAELAKHLVDLANKLEDELSGAFIKRNVVSSVLEFRSQQRFLNDQAKEELQRHDIILRCKQHQEEFSRNCRGMISTGEKLTKLLGEWPKGLTFPITGEFQTALKTAKKVINDLSERI